MKSASRSVSASGASSPELRGAHSSSFAITVTPRRSRSTVTGVRPRDRAAAYTNGLKAEPGWRRLRTARLNEDFVKSEPPTSASRSPVFGSSATSAACRFGIARRASPRATEASAAACTDGTNVVWTCQSAGWSSPTRSRNCARRKSLAYPPRASSARGCAVMDMRVPRACRAAASVM